MPPSLRLEKFAQLVAEVRRVAAAIGKEC